MTAARWRNCATLLLNSNKCWRKTLKTCRHSSFYWMPPDRMHHLDFRLLCLAHLPYVLPATVRSISPRKCISLRELQTTKRMPTVCSPSTSHFSRKNRCILSPSLCFSQQKSFFNTGRPRSPPRYCNQKCTAFVFSVSQSPSICRDVAILFLYAPHPFSCWRFIVILLISSLGAVSPWQQDCRLTAPPPLPLKLSKVV